jgi:hypothetical protein
MPRSRGEEVGVLQLRRCDPLDIGGSIGSPLGSTGEDPTSSRTMLRAFGLPSGAPRPSFVGLLGGTTILEVHLAGVFGEDQLQRAILDGVAPDPGE